MSGKSEKVTYDPRTHPTLIFWMSRNGLTNEEMARELGISRRLLQYWRNEFPAVAEAMRKGKDLIDCQVEESLLRRAMGMATQEVTVKDVITVDEGGRPKGKATVLDQLMGTRAGLRYAPGIAKPMAQHDTPGGPDGLALEAITTPVLAAGKARVGLTAGASAPEVLVQDVIARVKALGAVAVRKMDGVVETVKFPLPKGLKIEP